MEALWGHALLLLTLHKTCNLSVKHRSISMQTQAGWKYNCPHVQSHCMVCNDTVVALFSSAINIRMISEGSRDTEDWGNDAENSACTTEEYILELKQLFRIIIAIIIIIVAQYYILMHFLSNKNSFLEHNRIFSKTFTNFYQLNIFEWKCTCAAPQNYFGTFKQLQVWVNNFCYVLLKVLIMAK